MLHQGNKISILLFLCLFFVNCNQYEEFNAKKIKEIRENTIQLGQTLVGEDEYNNIYAQMNDSVHTWIANKLEWYEYYDGQRVLIVDSILCINKKKDKIITTVLKRCLDDCVQDNIEHFYGIKIKGRWYFFDGANLTLPREYYQEDIHTPLSFEKLKQIATAHIYRGYLKKGIGRQWEINDKFFARFYNYDAYNYPFTTQEAWEESWLKLCRKKWTKRDTTDNE